MLNTSTLSGLLLRKNAMTTVIVETRIDAPLELCFDLARDVDVHVQTSCATKERAVDGKTTGRLELGDVVTFEGIHFGIRQRLSGKITEYDRPRRFVDEMMKGAFSSLRHVHEFSHENGSILMRDTLTWRAPFGIVGRFFDKVLLERHMRTYLVEKQKKLKSLAEEMATPAG